jgi:glucan phosphoethanolaminetransferase (alkaline phosphatase superfamily)
MRPVLPGFILTVLACAAYAGFEWLFLVTQGGFMVSFAPVTRASALAALVLAAAAVAVPLWLLLHAVDLVRMRRMGTTPRLAASTWLAAAILTCLVFLLIDNFTYTVMGFGVVTAGAWIRFLYIPLLALVARRLLRPLSIVEQAWTRSGVPVWVQAVAAVVLMASAGLVLWQYRRAAPALPEVAGGSAARPASVLIVTLDGVEARRTSAYGYARDTTPFLKALAARSLVFENAFANAGRTTGSLTSLFTSKAPTRTKVIFPPHVLTERHAFEHLPGMLKQAGYRSFQYSVRYYADAADLSLQGGFDEANGRAVAPLPGPILRRFASERYFIDRVAERIGERLLYVFGIRPIVNHYRLIQLPTSIYGEHSDRERVDRTLEAIDRESSPFFGHVHLMGTHCCGYRIRRPIFSRGEDASRVDREDDAIRQADGEVARLIDGLEARGRLDDTLVIVTSDHTLGWGTFQRLPLVVRLPGADRHGRVTENVELLDVAPTVLDVVGLPIPPWMEGSTLLERQRGWNVIESVSEIERERLDADWEQISRLTDPSPPLYGLTTVGAVVCDRWLRIDIRAGNIATGLVDGHTAPCAAEALPPPSSVGLQVLLDLRAEGVDLPAPAMRPLQNALRTAMWHGEQPSAAEGRAGPGADAGASRVQ